jgi:hypothetical protein
MNDLYQIINNTFPILQDFGLHPMVLVGAVSLVFLLIVQGITKYRNRDEWRDIGENFDRRVTVPPTAEENFPTEKELLEMEKTAPARRVDDPK